MQNEEIERQRDEEEEKVEEEEEEREIKREGYATQSYI